VTAGNASGINEGRAMIIASEEASLRRLTPSRASPAAGAGVEPRVRARTGAGHAALLARQNLAIGASTSWSETKPSREALACLPPSVCPTTRSTEPNGGPSPWGTRWA